MTTLLYFGARATRRLLRPVVVWSVKLCLVSIAFGQPRQDFQVLDLVVDRQLFDEICEIVRVNPNTYSEALRLFEEYSSAVASVDDEAQRQIVDLAKEIREHEKAAFKHAMQDNQVPAYRGNDDLETLVRRKSHVVSARRNDADVLLFEWLDKVGQLCGLSERDATRILILVRWRNLRAPAQTNSGQYRVRLNLLELVDTASVLT